MADNLQLDLGSGGKLLATAELAFSGDTAQIQVSSLGILTGSEGSWTNTLIVGGAGGVGGGVQRVTLANDDTLTAAANALLTTIDADTSKIPALGTAAMAAAAPVTIASDDVIGLAIQAALEGTLTVGSHAVTNAGTFAVQSTLQANSGVDIGDVDVTTVGSVVDANNSTTTPLTGDAVYTGTGTDLLGYSAVCVTLYADVDSATDGMTFQFSQDDSNWDDTYNFTMDISSSDTRRFQFPVTSRYFRVVYTNGSGAQSAFRVQTILHTANQLTSIHRLVDNMSPDRSAQVVKAALFAQAAGSGDLVLVDATAGGNLKVAVEEFDAPLPAGTNNIGDVDVLTVPAPLSTTGGGTEATALRVTIANDSTGTLTVDTTGTSGIEVVQATAADLNMTEASAGAIKTAVEVLDNTVAVLGTATYSEATTSGTVVGAVRNDDLATLADTDNELAPLQVDNQGAMYVNQAASEPKRASGVAAGGAPGTDDIVAAVASRKIRVLALGLFATSATANNVFLDNADNDLLFNTGNPLPLAIDADADNVAGFVLPYNPGGWFETDTVNEAVTLNSSAAQDIAWTITYCEVP